MALRKRTIVRIETDSLALIRPASTPVDLWCEECAVKVPMLTAEAFAAMAGTTEREIYRRVEMGALHFNETADGALRVCVNSLGRTTPGSDT